MVAMGDEVRRTQGGNNNVFCQNNEISWFDWRLIEKHRDADRFMKAVIALRMNRDLPVERLDMTLNELLSRQPVQWHGVRLTAPDWGHQSHTLAATIQLLGYRMVLHLIVNAYWEPLEFEVPPLEAEAAWRRCIDTYLDPPDDICSWTRAPRLQGLTYRVQPRSLVVLLANAGTEQRANALAAAT
jgi:isoamylase